VVLQQKKSQIDEHLIEQDPSIEVELCHRELIYYYNLREKKESSRDV
jgi:hypothetical protein